MNSSSDRPRVAGMSSSWFHPSQYEILIVDDNLENIRLLNSLLGNQGYGTRKVRSGKMALTAIATQRPDLVLLDINMPEMDGYEVCRRLRSQTETMDLAVIFLSALNSPQDKVKAFQVGGDDYVSKPFQVEEVLIRVEKQLKLKVAEEQIQQQNQELEKTLQHLKDTQFQLIQREKSLGIHQLAAGMAHEINNPLGFISGNLAILRDHVQQLIQVVDYCSQDNFQVPLALRQLLEEIDADFIQSDLQSITDSMQRGIERISSIMTALKIFARLNEADIKSVDLVQALHSTLLLINQRLHHNRTGQIIQVVQQYSSLPRVTCYAGQVNQVFLAILNNGIEAIERRWTTGEGVGAIAPTLTLSGSYHADTDRICFNFRDNGIGIDPGNQHQVFNAFFTTKPIGEGVGLSLSQCYRIIVDGHGGNLSFQSQPYVGTTFTLQLPTTLSAGAKPTGDTSGI